MYNYICGKITSKTETSLVIENGGIGYEIGASGNTLYDSVVGETVKIYTYLYVREDVFALYGFSRIEEKNLFLKLIEISGIGPKMAMQILGGYDLRTLTVAIATGDTKTLCKIKGLGKKTAELIVLNLRDKAAEDLTSVESGSSLMNDELSGAVFALESLGVSKTEAVEAVNQASKVVSGLENIITHALKIVAR